MGSLLKKKNKKIPVFLTVLIIGVLFSAARLLQNTAVIFPNAADKEAYISRVIDGDTVELPNGETVRYIGIDTPEISEKKDGVWVYNPRPYAEAAKEFNRKLVEGKSVRLEFDVQKKDKYNRILAYLYIDDKMINAEMLKEGYAMIYTYPPNVKHSGEFLAAQRFARDKRNGLWSRMDEGVISSSEAGENMGFVRAVETEVLSTFISDKALILNCRENFKIVIFKNNLAYFPVSFSRSPESYFKHKKARVYGLIQDYKGAPEIVISDPLQLEILE